MQDLVSQATQTRSVMASECKMCHWRSLCKQKVIQSGDLTLKPELGRSKRDVLAPKIPTIKAKVKADLDSFVIGRKTVFPRIGISSLVKYQKRAQLLTTPNGG